MYTQKYPDSTFYSSAQTPYNLQDYSPGCGLRRRRPYSNFCKDTKYHDPTFCSKNASYYHPNCVCSIKVPFSCQCDCYTPSLLTKLVSAPYTKLNKKPLKTKKPQIQKQKQNIKIIQRPAPVVTYSYAPQYQPPRPIVNFHTVPNQRVLTPSKPVYIQPQPNIIYNSFPQAVPQMISQKYNPPQNAVSHLIPNYVPPNNLVQTHQLIPTTNFVSLQNILPQQNIMGQPKIINTQFNSPPKYQNMQSSTVFPIIINQNKSQVSKNESRVIPTTIEKQIKQTKTENQPQNQDKQSNNTSQIKVKVSQPTQTALALGRQQDVNSMMSLSMKNASNSNMSKFVSKQTKNFQKMEQYSQQTVSYSNTVQSQSHQKHQQQQLEAEEVQQQIMEQDKQDF